jgi:hypothetical protein
MLWLIPLDVTAKRLPVTAYLSNMFVVMSIANLQNESERFIGPVVALDK